MANLISSGCSPLNNLRNKHLSILTGKQARELIKFGFPNGLDPEVEETLFRLTGRHPYLLQGLLEKFWEIREEEDELDVKAVKGAAREFLQEHHDFTRWLEAFGSAGRAVYQLLSEAPGGTLSVREIRQRIDPVLASQTEEALTILSYHGVIDDTDPDEPQIAGTLFQVWYRDNRTQSKPNESLKSEPPVIRLFYSYSHKDEILCNKLETHLSLLKKEGYIHDWHDRKIGAGQEWKNSIDENLKAAKIILLLVSSDFIASDYCYGIEMKRALENHKAGEVRVIPVILRHCEWDKAPFANLQALPKDAKPVMKWSNRDEAWMDVARGIRKVVEEMRKRLFKEG
jgi:TIR domain